MREVVPIEAHGDLHLPVGHERRPALDVLRAQDATRLTDLVPIRYGRMMASPFSFFRGAAAVMASDLSSGPRTTAAVQLCGDAHLANFGMFLSPERRLVFDVNDFDETLRGPFEWDVKRLVTSCVLAGREAGLGAKQRRRLVVEATGGYHAAIAAAAAMAPLDVWYFRLDYDDLVGLVDLDKRDRKVVAKARQQANLRTSLGALDKLTEVVDGKRVIKTRRPLIVGLGPDELDEFRQQLDVLIDEYLSTLQANRRSLLGRYTIQDVAMKVVGVGSVGTRCFVVLLQSGDGQPLFLQLKEAGQSVLEAHLGPSDHDQAGQRVVVGQQEIQAASDVFLGWARFSDDDGSSVDYYFRQLRDGKYSPSLRHMGPEQLRSYGRLCGVALGRAHARSGQPALIAGYLGDGVELTDAMIDFAVAYAELTEADHAQLVAAVDRGDIEARGDL